MTVESRPMGENDKPSVSEITRIVHHDLVHETLGTVEASLYHEGTSMARVIVFGRPRSRPQPLVRVQSDCFYGEVIGAADCDCRQQLTQAFNRFQEDGAGILIHLDQEGRGVGLVDKAKAYALQQERGLDTVDAYNELGLPVDDREYGIAAAVLDYLGTRSISLLTNNPKKVEKLEAAGLVVREVPLRCQLTEDNLPYLIAKQQKLDHDLNIPDRLVVGDQAQTRDDVIVIIGAAVTDHVFELESNPKLGHARQTTHYERRAGGKGFNQAIQIARLGGNVHLVSVIGNDSDARVITDTLLKEGIQPHLLPSPHGVSPQTAVILPQSGAPTYIGWLGEEHRSLSANGIGRFANTLGRARGGIFTLEVSTAAMQSALDQLPPDSLRVLNASPAVERGYRVNPPILDRFSIILGNADELVWLASSAQEHRFHPEEAALQLATAYGAIVLLAEMRKSPRHVDVYWPGKGVVWNASGMPSMFRVSTAVGNKDAFCGALVLRLVEKLFLPQAADDDGPATTDQPELAGYGREAEPGADETRVKQPLLSRIRPHLKEALFFALGVEEYVARTSAGYTGFPDRDTLEDFLATQGGGLSVEGDGPPDDGPQGP